MRLIAGTALIAIAACTPVERNEIARDAARSTLTPVLLERYPDIRLDRSLDCIMAGASAAEIDALAADRITGATAATRATVDIIAGRPRTSACLAG